MKPCSSDKTQNRAYFCEEPWIGIFSIGTNGDVVCCPCYAKVIIGNIFTLSVQEIWNSETLINMRSHFSNGELPESCKHQLCPVVVGGK